MLAPTTGFAPINNALLHFEQAGSGAPLVLLHGLGLNLHMWDSQFSYLAEHFHVIRYDLRGFGLSLPVPATPFSHTEDLKALLDYLQIQHAHVLGLSLGGRIVIDFSLMHPTMVDRLVLADTALGGYRFSESWHDLMTHILQEGEKGNLTEAKRLWLEHPLFNRIRNNPQNWQRFEKIAISDAGWHWLNQGLELTLNPPAIQRLQDLNAPALILVGEHDLTDFHVIADMLDKSISHAKKCVLSNAGHMANMEVTEKFNETVLDFLLAI